MAVLFVLQLAVVGLIVSALPTIVDGSVQGTLRIALALSAAMMAISLLSFRLIAGRPAGEAESGPMQRTLTGGGLPASSPERSRESTSDAGATSSGDDHRDLDTNDDDRNHEDGLLPNLIARRLSEVAEASRRELAVVEHAVDVICSLDAGGTFLSVSPASEKLWQISPTNLIGRRLAEIVLTEDRPLVDRCLRDSCDAGRPWSFECRVVTNDEQVIDMLWSASWSDKEQRLFCVAHDMTERKKMEEELKASEARFRKMFDYMPAALVLSGLDGTIELVNPVTRHLFGYSSEELALKKLHDLLSHRDQTMFSGRSQDTRNFPIEVDAVRKDGSILPAQMYLSRFSSQQGPRFLGIFTDETQRRAIERLKEDFVNMVSHDLRTPLSNVQTFLTMLLEGIYGQLGEEGSRKAAAADRNVTRLIALINELLDLEKVQSGKLALDLDSIDLSEVVTEAVEAVSQFAERLGIELEVSVGTMCLIGDSRRLVQVLVNIIGNALKFAPEGSSIEVSAGETDGLVTVRIADRGPGVPDDCKTSVFDRFSQLKHNGEERITGTGLGLAICRSIVESHGGKIGVADRDGGGSVFWFQLPLTHPVGRTAGEPVA